MFRNTQGVSSVHVSGIVATMILAKFEDVAQVFKPKKI